MEQYYRLFSSYREPGLEKDRLKMTEAESAGEVDHIIVIYKNKVRIFTFYSNNVYKMDLTS